VEGTLVPFGFMAMIVALVVIPRYFRSQERQKMAELMKAAIERGQPLPQDIIDAMSTQVREPRRASSPSRDLRVGLIWLSVAVGLAALGAALSFDEPDSLLPLLGCAAFPGFIGVAFVIMWAVSRDRT
jgi:hypothetical protein